MSRKIIRIRKEFGQSEHTEDLWRKSVGENKHAQEDIRKPLVLGHAALDNGKGDKREEVHDARQGRAHRLRWRFATRRRPPNRSHDVRRWRYVTPSTDDP